MGEGLTAVAGVLTANGQEIKSLANCQADIKEKLQALGKGEYISRLFYMLEDCQTTVAKLKAAAADAQIVGNVAHQDAERIKQGMSMQLEPEQGERLGKVILEATAGTAQSLQSVDTKTFDPLNAAIDTALAELEGLRDTFLAVAEGVGENATILDSAATEVLNLSRKAVS